MLFVIFPLLLLIFYLSLIFVSFIIICLGLFLLGFILPGTLCASYTWLTISFPMFEELSVISSNIFSGPFSLSSSGTPKIWRLVCLMLLQRSLRLSSFFFSFFFLYSVLWQWFPPFCLPGYLSILLQLLLLIASSVLFICSFLFFSSSMSLVNICIFSILFLRFWIIFIIISLNPLCGRLPISTSAFILSLHLGHNSLHFYFD